MTVDNVIAFVMGGALGVSLVGGFAYGVQVFRRLFTRRREPTHQQVLDHIEQHNAAWRARQDALRGRASWDDHDQHVIAHSELVGGK